MKLVFLHGAPATGKLTIARALLDRVSGRLLDNHAAIDFAKTMFEFGALGFWPLTHEVRLAALDAAALYAVPLVVMTYCYSESGDQASFEEFEELMHNHDGEVLPVFLHCSEDKIARRIGNPNRAQRGKLASMEGLGEFRLGYRDAPVPRANCLELDSAARSAAASAEEIIACFGLDALRAS